MLAALVAGEHGFGEGSDADRVQDLGLDHLDPWRQARLQDRGVLGEQAEGTGNGRGSPSGSEPLPRGPAARSMSIVCSARHRTG